MSIRARRRRSASSAARCSVHIAEDGGGISIADKPVTEQPGGEALPGQPAGSGYTSASTWAHAPGVYYSGTRRLIINSGAASASVSVPLHEFGHAADDAYGTLSQSPEWSAAAQSARSAIGGRPGWNPYFDNPKEFWAEGFACWTKGGDSMLNLTAGEADAAKTLKEYFNGVFGAELPDAG